MVINTSLTNADICKRFRILQYYYLAQIGHIVCGNLIFIFGQAPAISSLQIGEQVSL